MDTLNEVYSSLSTRCRYEVRFLRVGLADGSGAWWFRYLLMNPGRDGCPGNPRGIPVQIWATWFPRHRTPHSFIQGFPPDSLDLSDRGESPFHFRIGENACRGRLEVDGHQVSWGLHYRSRFRVTLSSKGWIGFSRSPHSDAVFSGRIALDGHEFQGRPLGFGVQGHTCGYRHRGFWTWAHAYFPNREDSSSSVEALVYDMPFGLVFRKAVLWHNGQDVPGTAHCIEGCVIADSPEHGVVDAHHRIFGYKNIYVWDGSVVAANLGVNPSLTITVLAERAMSFISAEVETTWHDGAEIVTS